MTNRILLCALAVLCSPVQADDANWGVWVNATGTITYTFASNNEFKYATAFKDATPSSYVGAWQTSDNACWAGEKKENVGNLMLYVEGDQCCVSAQMLGKRLVLSYVWHKGSPYKPGFCYNQVLERKSP